MTSPGPRYFTTGELAQRTGATPRAIRFYEQVGLIAPHARDTGNRRRYTAEDLERLQLITDLRDLDLSIEDIKQLLYIRDTCQTPPELGKRMGEVLAEQLDATQRRLQSLRRLREELAATLAVVKECTGCNRPLQSHPCAGCDNVTRPESPRMVKVLLGQCGLARTSQPIAAPLVQLKGSPEPASPDDDPACEP